MAAEIMNRVPVTGSDHDERHGKCLKISETLKNVLQQAIRYLKHQL